MKIIVGLGNPGREYAATRHNVGFMVIDELADELGITIDKKKFNAHYGEGRFGSEKLLLVKPQTYMNLSGEAVGTMASWYKVAPEDVIVVYDDMDLPLGKLRVRGQGSAGGHNGVKSLISHLGTEKFPRVKIGIGRGRESINHVLAPFAAQEREEVLSALNTATLAVKALISEGLLKAMNTYNG